MYVKIDENGKITRTSLHKLRKDNPNISFPRGLIPEETLADFNVFPSYEEEEPSIDTLDIPTQKFELEDTPRLVDGKYVYHWKIVEMNDAEKAETYKRWNLSSRNHRHNWLTMSDWTQIPDASISDELREEYKVWRSALRNVTSDPKWPFFNSNDDWPTPPAGFLKFEESGEL